MKEIQQGNLLVWKWPICLLPGWMFFLVSTVQCNWFNWNTNQFFGSCRSRCLQVTNMSVARRARGQPSPHCHWFHCNTTGIWIFVFSPHVCFPLLFNGVCFKTKSRMQLVILQWIYIFLDFFHCVLLRCSSNTTWKTTLKDNFCLGSEFFLWQIWKIDLLFEPSQKFEQRKNVYFCFV